MKCFEKYVSEVKGARYTVKTYFESDPFLRVAIPDGGFNISLKSLI
jgi:hypothetical protein